jgi:hypothetical protein
MVCLSISQSRICEKFSELQALLVVPLGPFGLCTPALMFSRWVARGGRAGASSGVAADAVTTTRHV